MFPVLSTKDESVPLFKNGFLDFFTRVHWSMPLIMFVPVTLYFMQKGLGNAAMPLWQGFAWIFSGILTWSLLEYLLHRFVFHFEPKTPKLRWLFYIIHGIHHQYPNDSWRLVLPPVLSIPLAFAFYYLYFSIFSYPVASCFFSGFTLGYLAYDMTHFMTHHRKMKSKVGQYLKRYHLKHHLSSSQQGFGVSSPVWDHVFKTTFKKSS